MHDLINYIKDAFQFEFYDFLGIMLLKWHLIKKYNNEIYKINC
jgi:hypothetical protein